MPVRVLAGLGNPGSAYDGTRHNAGFIVLDALATRLNATWRKESRFCAHTATVDYQGNPLLLCKPQSYMNLSGEVLGNLMRFHKWSFTDLLVAYDEFQIPLGQCKVSMRGSAGGHNGVENLLQHCSPDFIRYRIGIGPELKPPQPMADFVLGKFTPEESVLFQNRLPALVDGLLSILSLGPVRAMNHLNQRPKPHESQTS